MSNEPRGNADFEYIGSNNTDRTGTVNTIRSTK